MAGLRNIRKITITRHFGNTPDSVIWTNIAQLFGYNIKFVEPKRKDNLSAMKGEKIENN